MAPAATRAARFLAAPARGTAALAVAKVGSLQTLADWILRTCLPPRSRRLIRDQPISFRTGRVRPGRRRASGGPMQGARPAAPSGDRTDHRRAPDRRSGRTVHRARGSRRCGPARCPSGRVVGPGGPIPGTARHRCRIVSHPTFPAVPPAASVSSPAGALQPIRCGPPNGRCCRLTSVAHPALNDGSSRIHRVDSCSERGARRARLPPKIRAQPHVTARTETCQDGQLSITAHTRQCPYPMPVATIRSRS